jgi:ferredoxin
VLRSRPGTIEPWAEPRVDRPVYPVIRCVQQIPCDPCSEACPEKLIGLESIMALPRFDGACLGCARCVVRCPGLAINLVCEDYDPTRETALVVLPFELDEAVAPAGRRVPTVGFDGEPVGTGTVIGVRERADQDRRKLLLLEVPYADRRKVAGFSIRGPSIPIDDAPPDGDDDPIVCRCERVRRSEIVGEIRAGVTDVNQLKALCRVSMGGCGGKTCGELLRRIYREEGIDLERVVASTSRPLVAEVPLGLFAKPEGDDG